MHLNNIALFLILYALLGFITVIVARLKFKQYWNTADEKDEPLLIEYFAVWAVWFLIAGGITIELIKGIGRKKNVKVQRQHRRSQVNRKLHHS